MENENAQLKTTKKSLFLTRVVLLSKLKHRVECPHTIYSSP